MINENEKALIRRAIDMALTAGADKVRVTYSHSRENLVATLNGEVDKVTSCNDMSANFAIFADGRYGTFSTNGLSEAALDAFVRRAVELTRSIAPDPCRDLPAPERCCRSAVTGMELDLVDTEAGELSPEERVRRALDAAAFGRNNRLPEGCRIISEEGELSDSIYDVLVMDSAGLCCLHSESSYDYGVETTIEADGAKYSGYWWDSSTRLGGIDPAGCGRKALARALAQRGSGPAGSGIYNMVVDSELAPRLVTPLLRALSALAIQQGNSFLAESLGKQVFHEGMTLVDRPHIRGNACSKLFDSEGVASHDADIIKDGRVCQYFVSTFSANKTGLAPTIEAAVRPVLRPWPKAGLSRNDLMQKCGSGILVTDFNGGNSNPATGDFSYGVEGFLFEDGRPVRPVSGMVVTGNFIKLWSNLIAVADDVRSCMSKLIPTLAFSNADFSGQD